MVRPTVLVARDISNKMTRAGLLAEKMSAPSASLIKQAFESFRANPPDLRQIGDQAGEIKYVESTLPSYQRTVSDILEIFPGREDLEGLNFIELGAFLGIVSKALSIAKANVVPCDIPEFFGRKNVVEYYRKMNLAVQSFNLRDYHLPFPTHSQDCVIACETFEHLNFNPLPVIAEINRVLKPGGYFYIAMPNGGYLLKRLSYLRNGVTPGFSVSELFAQLDPNDNMVVGLHWKEYSLSQTIEMVSPVGFEVIRARTLNDTGSAGKSLKRRALELLIPGGDTQVAVFRKSADFSNTFHVCRDS
jgi:SAM-dependent methyltransferase